MTLARSAKGAKGAFETRGEMAYEESNCDRQSRRG